MNSKNEFFNYNLIDQLNYGGGGGGSIMSTITNPGTMGILISCASIIGCVIACYFLAKSLGCKDGKEDGFLGKLAHFNSIWGWLACLCPPVKIIALIQCGF